MQTTFEDGLQVTRSVGTVVAYAVVVVAWMAMRRMEHLGHEICLANGELTISTAPLGYLVGSVCVVAGGYASLAAIRLGRKGHVSHPAAHGIFILLGLMLLLDRSSTWARLGPEGGTLRNGVLAAPFEFEASEFEALRLVPHSASGPPMPRLEFRNGRSIQLNWDPLPRVAVIQFVEQTWGEGAGGWSSPLPHVGCDHSSEGE